VFTSGACVVGMLSLPLSPAMASPMGATANPPRAGQVNLGIDSSTAARVLRPSATRVVAAEEGASQEADTEKPKAMDDQAATAKAKSAPKAAEPEDPYAFLKDWPFWVIVGGAVIAGAATYMLVKNANDVAPCGARYTSGCFGAR